MARLFAAVRLDAAAHSHLADALAPFQQADPGGHAALRWVRPQLWHVTVLFLGEVGEDRRVGVDEACAAAARASGPLGWSLGPARLLPTVSRPSVLVLPAVTGDDAMLRLHRHLRRGAASARVRVERRRFFPHLTLARTRTRDAAQQARVVVDALTDYGGPHVRSSTMALLSSHGGPHPRYETVAEWSLDGPADSPARRSRPTPPGTTP